MSFDRALAAYQASRFEECLALLEGSNDGRAQSICAACYLHLGHWPQAAALYGQLHRQDPSDLEAAYGLGLACLALEDLPTAEQVFQRVVRLDPSHQRAWFQLGTVYCSASKWRSAIDCLTRSLEFFPDDVEALTNLGVAYLQSGDSERARRAWQKALDFNPGAQGAAQNLARLDSQATASFGAVTVDTQLDVDRAAIASQVRQGLIETGRFEHRPEGVPVVVRLEVGGSLFETVYVITIMVGETTESVEATSLEHIASVCRLGCAQFGPDAIRAPGEDPQACLLLGQQLISSLQQDSSCTPALKEQALATAEKLEQFASQQPDLRLTAAGLYDLLDDLDGLERCCRDHLDFLDGDSEGVSVSERLSGLARERLLGRQVYAWMAAAGLAKANEDQRTLSALGSLIDWVYSPSGGFHAGSGAIRSFSSAVCALAHAARGNVPLADLPFYLWASRRALVALVGESGFASWLEVDSQAQASQLVLELRQAIHQASPLLSKACLRALAQRSEGNFGGALEAFRQAVAEAPQCGLLRSLTGRCLMSLDRVDEAKKCLGEAGKLPRLLGEDLLWLSVLAMDLDRDFNRAATYLEQAVEHEPLNPLYRSVLAIAYGNAGQIENALLAAEVACRYGPHLSQSWEARGRALRHQGSYQEALVCFGRAMRLGADPCEMSAYRALCLAHLGDFVGAQLDLELAARSGRTLAHQGLVTAMAGQKKEARALLEAYFAGDYKSELHEEAQACLGGLAKSWFRNPFKR